MEGEKMGKEKDLSYNFKTVEEKWQKIWEEEKTFEAKEDSSKPRC